MRLVEAVAQQRVDEEGRGAVLERLEVLPPMAGDKPRAGADSAVTGFEPPDSAGTDSTLFGAGMRGLDLMAPGQGESVGATPPGTAGEQAAMAALAMQ